MTAADFAIQGLVFEALQKQLPALNIDIYIGSVCVSDIFIASPQSSRTMLSGFPLTVSWEKRMLPSFERTPIFAGWLWKLGQTGPSLPYPTWQFPVFRFGLHSLRSSARDLASWLSDSFQMSLETSDIRCQCPFVNRSGLQETALSHKSPS